MARVPLVDTAAIADPVIAEICAWVTQMEGAVPNHFRVEMNFPEYFKAKLGSTKVLWQCGELALPEIQHVGIAVSKANGCPYCTAAFCTILNYGLGQPEAEVTAFLDQGAAALAEPRLRAIVDFALKANADPAALADADFATLRTHGLTDRGLVQLIHLVSDFASYNRLNLAVCTDYDYRDLFRVVGFGWDPASGGPPGDNRRGLR
jgi:uncharacterized peroxidase-related enzyme